MLRDGLIALERAGIGDLHGVGDDRARVFARLRASYPAQETKDGTIRTWTSVLLRFAFAPAVGDLVVHPDPIRRTVSVGRITSGYRFESAPRELHLRDARWVVRNHPRDRLSDGAKQAVSQRTAFFEIRGEAASEFAALLA